MLSGREVMKISRFLGFWGLVLLGLSNLTTVVGVGTENRRFLVNVEAGRPPGVVWVVQLSDLHISVHHPERAQSLQKLMGRILPAVTPSLVLITGDLTDAKTKDGKSTRQYEAEWTTYQKTVEALVTESGISESKFFDLRGNHDKYGVPHASSSLDFFSRYSCTARFNRTGLVQSVTLLGENEQKHLFVGVDDSMSVGLRGPSNLFGHPSDDSLAKLDEELSQWERKSSSPVTKVVFGHFPMSFTASSESGKRPEELLAKHNISAYLCGHLHTKFGSKLYRLHIKDNGNDFWEWEMGDWRVSRMMRVLSIDHGHISFVDVDLKKISKAVLKDGNFTMPTIILPTYPLNSQMMLRASSRMEQPDTGPIRTLIFCESPPSKVIAAIYDSASAGLVVNKLEMERTFGSSHLQSGAYYYSVAWEAENYSDLSPTRYWLQIQVLQADGNWTASEKRPFSVNGVMAPFKLTFLGYLGMGVDWESFYQIIIWASLCLILGGSLFIPRIFLHVIQKHDRYEYWAGSVYLPSSGKFYLLKLPFWAMVEGSRNSFLWWIQVIFIGYLTFFPWLWGKVLADDYPIGYMSLRGWTVWPSKTSLVSQSGVGVPDILGIVLLYMLEVVFPLVLLVAAFSTEKAACVFHLRRNVARKRSGTQVERESLRDRTLVASSSMSQTDLNGTKSSQDTEPLLGRNLAEDQQIEEKESDMQSEKMDNEQDQVQSQKLKIETKKVFGFVCHRPIRKAYLLGCLAVAYLHLKQCLWLASAFGARTLVLSPVYVWTAPVLMVATIYGTSSIE